MSVSIRLFFAAAVAFMFLSCFAGRIEAQSPHLQSLIQSYKEQNPDAAKKIDSRRPNRVPPNPSGYEPYQVPQSEIQQGMIPPPGAYPGPYYPGPNPPVMASNTYPPSSMPQVPIAPMYSPRPAPPMSQPQFPPSIELMKDPNARADDIIYQQRSEEIPLPPNATIGNPISNMPAPDTTFPGGGNPKDPLNIHFTPESSYDPNRLPTPYDEMVQDARLNNVFFVAPQRGWVVGDRGAIWKTEDGGKNWARQESPICCSLKSVYFLNENFGVAVGGFLHPFTNQGRGVILQTQDGGNRWSIVPIAHIPILHYVKMLDSMKGLAAGESSEYFPSGLFQTNDGGRNWKPVYGGKAEGWNVVDFYNEKTGFGIGCSGTIQIFRDAPKLAQVPALGSARLNGIKLVSKSTDEKSPKKKFADGWMVGDGGLVLSTSDRGLRWGVAPGRLPGNGATSIDLNTVEARGPRLWVAGNPGSFIYRSDNSGKDWKAVPTGSSATIRKIVFTDLKNGCAVGDLGTILTTVDGGDSWQKQQSGGGKLAMLGFFGRMEDIPLEVFVRLCAEQGYRGGVVMPFYDETRKRDRHESPWIDRIHEAIVRTGGNGAWESGHFPLMREEMQTSVESLLAKIDKENDGKGIQRIRERLVSSIRQWRPEIVLTSGSGNGKDPVKELILREVTESVKLAADPTAFPYQLTELGLAPWKVKKIHLALEEGTYGDVNLQTSELSVRLGQPIDEISFSAHGMVDPDWMVSTSVLGFSTSRDDCPPIGNRDFFAGIDLPPGSEARRALVGSYESRYEASKVRLQKRRHTMGIINNMAKVAAEKGEPGSRIRLGSSASELARKIDQEAAVQILFDMGRQFVRLGDWGSAVETFEVLSTQYAQHLLSRNGLLWLFRYHAGEESSWRTGQAGQTNISVDGKRKGTANPSAPAENMEKALSLIPVLEQNCPDLAVDPRIRFGLASVLRRKGWEQDSVRYYRARGNLDYDDVWGMRARAEYWLSLRDRTELPPEQQELPLPSIACSFTPTKPFLDGKFDKEFDEGTWFNGKLYSLTPEKPRKRLEEMLKNNLASGKPIGLKREEQSLAESKNFESNVIFMYDKTYLYFGLRCKKVDGFPYPPIAETPRNRDANIDDRDRVEIILDTDRDYGTYYTLTVDSRGWAVDACWGDKSWNPNWYIARHDDGDYWYIEVAIPFESLTHQCPAAGSVWGVGVRRIVPGFGIECWNAENSFDLTEGIGFLMFE